MTKLRSSLRAEDGIAMPVALAVLLICMILTATVANGADRLTSTSGEDEWSKRAFSAADAGVGVAVARLRTLGTTLPDAQCLTSGGVQPGTSGAAPGECPAYTESLGPGASFSFTVSPASATPNGCYEVPGAVVPPGAMRRCVTSSGTVNGVTRRVQAQIIAPRGTRHWVGILGLDGVVLDNSPQLDGCPPATVASNVIVDTNRNSSTNLIANVFGTACTRSSWTLSVLQGGSIAVHRDTRPYPPPQTTVTTEYVIDPPPVEWEAVERTNQNDLLSSQAGATTYTGNATWNANARVMNLGNDGRIVIRRGGDFHLCSLSLGNQGSIDFSTTEKTRIFIDSPTRPDSSCRPGSGNLLTENSARFNWPSTVADTDAAQLSTRAKNVEVYFYGNGQEITWGNQVRFAGLVHAPNSNLVLGNSAYVYGAVAGRHVHVTNGARVLVPTGLEQVGGTSSAWAAKGWGQCSSARPVATDPESGC